MGTDIVSIITHHMLFHNPADIYLSLASTVFQQYVASDDASETFASLKRIHGLIPYFMLKAALRISNPISMIRSLTFISE
jgi:hypothetical protein